MQRIQEIDEKTKEMDCTSVCSKRPTNVKLRQIENIFQQNMMVASCALCGLAIQTSSKRALEEKNDVMQ